MRSVICCLVVLISVALGAQFTCNVEYRNALMKNGYVRGTLSYSSDLPGRMLYKYDKTSARDEVKELFQFNGFNGMNGKNPSPYQNQFSFTTGSSCACETGYMDYAMPILHVDDSNKEIFESVYEDTGSKSAAGCDIFKRRAQFLENGAYNTYALDKITFTVTELHLDSDKMPCYAELANGKKYNYHDCQRTSIGQSTFTEPNDCKCGKPLDIAIVLDRSGSISLNEFRDEKGFIEDFASQFSYGPLEVNLAIINFRARAYLDQGLELTKGVTKANVDAAVAALGCPASCDDTKKNCNGNGGACCCCCGTCIACGMKMGSEQLATGRSFAFKLLIVLTDGYGNTLVDGTSCGNNKERCNGALQDQVDYLHSLVGGPSKVATYAIGVGVDRDTADQLLVIAGGNPDRVLRRDDFAELASNNVELIARACDENPNPCGGCCGFCSCGKCQAVDACLPSSPCNPAVVPPAGVCCADVPINCDASHEADPCNFYDCDDNATSSTAGKCVVTSSIECGAPANTTCFTRACVKETGLCATTPNTEVCPGVKECEDAEDCDDNNLCTTDICNEDGGCEWTSVNCSLTHTPNQCQILRCTPDKGCHFDQIPDSSCDDNNNCTIDFCDPDNGCSHTNVTCMDDDPCTLNLCDPINGCMFVPMVCDANETNPCALTFCENGTCAFRALDCTYTFPAEILVGSLTAAAIVGIVIAAVLCAAGVAGGGAYAYANAGGGGNASAVSNNPLYVGAGFSGHNPLAH